jgi:hypothetical protein
MLPQAALEFYASQQAVSITVRNEVRRLWRRMGDDFDASWRRVGPSVLTVIAEGQAQMALKARDYNHDVLEALDIPDHPEGELIPDSLVGVASDGRPLDTLAAQSVVTAKATIADGGTTQQGLDAGGQWAQLMAQLQVADAARVAVGIGAASRRNIAGHVRVLNPPVCQRCAILGGRFYRWSTGFNRHPRDDCTMMPVKSEPWAESNSVLFDPDAAYKAGQIKDITEAQAKAIAEGADLADVVNAYRGMSTTATQRVIQRTNFGPVSVQPGMPDILGSLSTLPRATGEARLTPEGIYQAAGADRGEAIRLLQRHGYIT